MIEINNGEFIIKNIIRSKIETSMGKGNAYQNFFRIDCPLETSADLNNYMVAKIRSDQRLIVKTIDDKTGKIVACYMTNASIDRVENDFSMMLYTITLTGDIVYPEPEPESEEPEPESEEPELESEEPELEIIVEPEVLADDEPVEDDEVDS